MEPVSGEFTILGQKVMIRDPSEAELAAVAMTLVNEKIQGIEMAKPNLAPNQVALLALLELAGDLVKDRRSIDLYREQLDVKVTELMADLGRMHS